MVADWAVEEAQEIFEGGIDAFLWLAAEAKSGSREAAFFLAMAEVQRVALERWLPRAADGAPGDETPEA
jgi:hypothetical protein